LAAAFGLRARLGFFSAFLLDLVVPAKAAASAMVASAIMR